MSHLIKTSLILYVYHFIIVDLVAEDGDFKFPTGVAFHPLGYIVVVDRANSLQIFEKTGAFLDEITKV